MRNCKYKFIKFNLQFLCVNHLVQCSAVYIKQLKMSILSNLEMFLILINYRNGVLNLLFTKICIRNDKLIVISLKNCNSFPNNHIWLCCPLLPLSLCMIGLECVVQLRFFIRVIKSVPLGTHYMFLPETVLNRLQLPILSQSNHWNQILNCRKCKLL